LTEETVKIEVELPVKLHETLEYICEIPPKHSLHDYIIKALEMDAESVADSDFGNTVYYHSRKIKELLKE